MYCEKIKELSQMKIDKIRFYLMDQLRDININCDLSSYVVAYVIVKADEDINISISSLDKFITTAKLNSDISGLVKNQLDGFWDVVTRAKSEYEVDLYKAYLLFDDTYRSSIGDDSTPIGLSQLAKELLDIKNDEKVADFCTGRGSFICNCFLDNTDAFYFGNELNHNNGIIASMRADILGGNITINEKDVFSVDVNERKYDKIFSNYPFGIKIRDYIGVKNNAISYLNKNLSIVKKTISGDWLFNTIMINCLNEQGKAIGIMSNGSLWSTNDVDVRRFFLENGFVEAIISLPAKLFSSTTIPVTMIVLSKNNTKIRFIDASEICQKCRRNNILTQENIQDIINAYSNDCEYSKKFTLDDLASQNYVLDAKKILAPKIAIENGQAFGSVIKSITRGAQLNASELDELVCDEPTAYQYLTLSDIQSGIMNTELSYITKLDKRLMKYCIKSNNLIISKIGVPIKAAVACVKEGQTILANGNLFVIELDEHKVNPYYLKAFFDSKLGIDLFASIISSGTMASISLDSLKNLKIPLPTIAKQNEIGNRYLKVLNEIVALTEQIDTKKKELRYIYQEEK